MKRSIIASAALTAAALATLVACNPTGSSEQTWPLPYKTTESGPDGTYITTTTYKPNSVETDTEVKTLDGMPFSEKSNFKFETSGGSSYILTTYPDGTPTYQKILTTSGHYFNGYSYTTKVEVFNLASASDATGTLTEITEFKYRDNSSLTSESTYMKDGAIVKQDYDYNYDNYNSYLAAPYYTFKRRENGGEPVVMCYLITRLNSAGTGPLEYEIYKGWVDTANKGTLVESMSEYASVAMSDSYTMKHINEAGTLETTKVTVDYMEVTVRTE